MNETLLYIIDEHEFLKFLESKNQITDYELYDIKIVEDEKTETIKNPKYRVEIQLKKNMCEETKEYLRDKRKW